MTLVERVQSMDPLARVIVARRPTLRFSDAYAPLADLVAELPRPRRREVVLVMPYLDAPSVGDAMAVERMSTAALAAFAERVSS